jgi:murein DD-endopeptidase MepM/ murein hydrolase activator NlpD
MSATYGHVRVNNRGGNHRGWDLQAEPNTRVLAVAFGLIVATGSNHPDFGSYVKLAFSNQAGEQRYAFYAHLNVVYVKLNDMVMPGDGIGLSGGTGMKEAKDYPHLHFELHTEQGNWKNQNGIIAPGPTGRLDPGEWLGYGVYRSSDQVSEGKN